MSKLTEYLVGVLLLCVGVLSFLYIHERDSVKVAKAQVAPAIQAAQEATQELQKAQISFRIDLDAIAAAQKVKQDITVQTDKVKERVDEVAKQVDAGTTSDATADAQLLDSMRQVYCQGSLDSIDSSLCSDSGHAGSSTTKKH